MSVRYASSPSATRWNPFVAIRLLLVLGVALFAASGAFAQAAYQPEFDLDVVSTRGADATTQVEVFTAIPYSNLRFRSVTGGFEAGYAVTVQVYRLNGQGQQQGLVRNQSWEREVTVPTYDATQAHDSVDRATQALALEPGRYSVEVQVEDAASRRSFVRETAVLVGDYTRGIAMSDPMLLDRYDSSRQQLFPNVGGIIPSNQEQFTLYYEVYAQRAADLRVTYVATEEGRVRERPSVRALLGLAEREQEELGTPFVLTEPLHVRSGRNQAALQVDTEQFDAGDYIFSIRLETTDGQLVAEAIKPFSVRWMGLEGQIRDLNEAIAQLRYVARDREVRAIRNAPTTEEQLALFRAFWERRDPTPGTARNERMEEYYYRVSFANDEYGRLTDQGWNTDRGEVYIRFGEPDIVERHPYNYGTKPYEIWYYNRHGRRFVFVDDNGMGDYELLVPIWDERTRM